MLDIIVPVYNEGDNILKLFDEIEKEISHSKQVLIVYDFIDDSTLPVVNAHAMEYSFPITPVLNTIAPGALNAIKMGMQVANSEMALVMMADSSDRLDIVDSMCKMMEDGYDIVCGSRYMKGGKHIGGPIFKGFLSRLAGISLHFLTGIPTHDCTNSFKLYRKSLLDSIEIESSGGFEIGLEIVVKAYKNGYKIGEVPSIWTEREDGESHFHMWKWLPHYLHWYFYCIFRKKYAS